MKLMTIGILLISTLSFCSFSQIQYQKEPRIALEIGIFGGHYYDIPSNTSLDNKFGDSKLVPEGGSVHALVESKFGDLKLDYFVMDSKEAEIALGTEVRFGYDSLHYDFYSKRKGAFYSNLDFHFYAHNQRFIFSDVDITQDSSQDNYLRVRSKFTQLGLNTGYKRKLLEKKIKDFNFTVDAQASIQPIGYMFFSSELQEAKVLPENQSFETAVRLQSYSSGAGAEVEAEAVYKGRVALVFKIDQEYFLTFDDSNLSINNRYIQAALEYRFKKGIRVGVAVANEENIWIDQNRKAIDVFNSSTIKLSIPLFEKR